MIMRKYVNVELNPVDAEKFRHYLKTNQIYYEASGVGLNTHFECKMTADEVDKANEFLATL